MTTTPDPLAAHGMTMDGEPAMPILVAEYNALVARVNEAETLLRRLAAEAQQQPETEAPTERATLREQLLHALDFSYCQGLGYSTPEALLAAYEARPRRGDAVETWLKAQRDEWAPDGCQPWQVLDQALEAYRLHADTGTPLDQHACEGQAVDGCPQEDTP